jgi:hypothetical protein
MAGGGDGLGRAKGKEKGGYMPEGVPRRLLGSRMAYGS